MFSTALAYFDAYRRAKCAALENKRRARWFTSEAKTLGGLFDDTFTTKADNDAWAKVYTAKVVDPLKLISARLRVNVVAGCRHDLREQFAVDTTHEQKANVDFDRHTWLIESAAAYVDQLLDKMLSKLDDGMKT